MSQLLNFESIADILVDPVTKDPLFLKSDFLVNITNNNRFPFTNIHQSPLLFPAEIIPYCKESSVEWIPLIETRNPIKQYFGISSIKWNGGAHNSPCNDQNYQNYLNDLRNLTADAKGILLDIGCDDPNNTVKHFPPNIQYIGLDPLYYIPSEHFKIHSIAEFLPFKDQSFDSICFGTSLDHTFDAYLAISEAVRVLKKGGNLYLSSLVWSENAELYRDSVHFHHFRENQIKMMLEQSGFSIKRVFKTFWKNDSHRKVLFLKATKNEE